MKKLSALILAAATLAPSISFAHQAGVRVLQQFVLIQVQILY